MSLTKREEKRLKSRYGDLWEGVRPHNYFYAIREVERKGDVYHVLVENYTQLNAYWEIDIPAYQVDKRPYAHLFVDKDYYGLRLLLINVPAREPSPMESKFGGFRLEYEWVLEHLDMCYEIRESGTHPWDTVVKLKRFNGSVIEARYWDYSKRMFDKNRGYDLKPSWYKSWDLFVERMQKENRLLAFWQNHRFTRWSVYGSVGVVVFYAWLRSVS